MFFSFIEINEGRINYELREYGSSVICVPSAASEGDVSDALAVLRSKYDHVKLKVDDDIVEIVISAAL